MYSLQLDKTRLQNSSSFKIIVLVYI